MSRKSNIEIINNEEFNELLSISSLLEFRKRINKIQEIKPSLELENRVMKYYDELLEQYDDETKLFLLYDKIVKEIESGNNEFFSNYNDFNYFLDKKLLIRLEDYCHYSDRVNLIYKMLLDKTKRNISEIVVDGLFKDTIYNVWINISELLRYNSLLNDNEKIIDEDRIAFYNLILNIDNLDCSEKIKLYNDLKNKNIAFMFYVDIRNAKNDAYIKLKKKLFRVNEHERLLNKEKSMEYGIDIYELNAERFDILVSCREYYQEFDYVRRHCYSLISDKNMEVYGRSLFVYGYNDFEINRILHVFESDSFSSNGNSFSGYSSTTNCVNRIAALEQLRNGLGYNEIQIVNKKVGNNKFEVMKPNYLVVFDDIEEKHIEEAKRLNIPIVKINSAYYLNELINKEFSEKRVFSYEKVIDDYSDGDYQEDIRIKKRVRR